MHGDKAQLYSEYAAGLESSTDLDTNAPAGRLRTPVFGIACERTRRYAPDTDRLNATTVVGLP